VSVVHSGLSAFGNKATRRGRGPPTPQGCAFGVFFPAVIILSMAWAVLFSGVIPWTSSPSTVTGSASRVSRARSWVWR
jgi:hypothetical protein